MSQCRSNGVRALGNMIRVCSERLLIRERERLVKEVVGVVLKNVDSGTVKVHLISAYAGTDSLTSHLFPDAMECLSRPNQHPPHPIISPFLRFLHRQNLHFSNIRSENMQKFQSPYQRRYSFGCSYDERRLRSKRKYNKCNESVCGCL